MDAAYTIVSLTDPFSSNPVEREIGTFCYLIVEAERHRPKRIVEQLHRVIDRMRCIESTTWERCCKVPKHEVIDKFETLLRRM